MRVFAAIIILLSIHCGARGQNIYCVDAHEYTRTKGNVEGIEKDKYKGEISLCFKDGSFIVTLNGDIKMLKVSGHAHRESQSAPGYMEDRVECEEGYSIIITYSQPGVVHIVGISFSKGGATYGYSFISNKLPVITTEDEAKPQHAADSAKGK
jgi:hypothetical protein